MDLTLERAAADLYATPWRTPSGFITLPLMWPGIIGRTSCWPFVISLDDVVITEFVKSGGQDTLPTYMLGQIKRSGITPEINAISTVFLGISLIRSPSMTLFLLDPTQETGLNLTNGELKP